MRPARRLAVSGLIVLLAAPVADAQDPAGGALPFNRDIRPILAKHCLECHGRDEGNRQAGVRFDQRGAALRPADSGRIPIVPRQPDASELVRRVESDDPTEMMPPPDSNKPLSDSQKQLLRQWISEGAPYEEHWAFVPPQRPDPPPVKQSAWLRNPIDNFILAKLEDAGLSPSPQADRLTLLRRLALDLTGLPPTFEEIVAFEQQMSAAEHEDQQQAQAAANDHSATSAAADRVFAAWVNRLLASPHYGERMAVDWLDAARFADTNGYQVDRDREAYAWRDWVIEAFNANMPFDQFTVEQLAGDLLPNVTLAQRIATGFHRNHMLNEEGGIIPEEFLTEYCADRVETTATVWLGQTFLCARCHDHKFDPFTQRDYYSLFAFFHNVPEVGAGNYGANIRRNAPPMLRLPAPELDAKKASLHGELTAVKEQLAQIEAILADGLADWEERIRHSAVAWATIEPTSARIGETALNLDQGRSSVQIPVRDPGRFEYIVETQSPRACTMALRLDFKPVAETTSAAGAAPGTAPLAPNVELNQLKVFAVVEGSAEPQPLTLRAAEIEHSLPAAEVAKAVDGAPKTGTRLSLADDSAASIVVELEPPQSKVQPTGVRLELSLAAAERTAPWELRILATDAACDLLLPADIEQIVRTEPQGRTAEQNQRVAEFRKAKHPDHRRMTERAASLTQQIDKTDLEIPTALVMEEMATPRPTHILLRGAYDKQGDAVTAETPTALPDMAPDLPRNRLGLAKWLVDPANPLTARVAVNRLWQSIFGVGLVRTAEDFGTQGEPPSHPKLLDWLATEFVRSGWDVKAMMSLLVTSSSYRQTSRLTPALRMRDPDNRLLARGPRFRLQAEFLRDQALAASGLLVRQIGGPSVRPYHPPGLYEQVVSGSSAGTYVVGEGSELYRRSLYTYWKRSVPNPAMLVFDAPFREMCVLRRSRTNTPLQALNLMNDPTYVEAARHLAQRMVREAGESVEAQITHGFRLVLVRPPEKAELSILQGAYARFLGEFRDDPDAAGVLLQVGESPSDPQIDQARLAALTAVASTILNLDEAVTKE